MSDGHDWKMRVMSSNIYLTTIWVWGQSGLNEVLYKQTAKTRFRENGQLEVKTLFKIMNPNT